MTTDKERSEDFKSIKKRTKKFLLIWQIKRESKDLLIYDRLEELVKRKTFNCFILSFYDLW